MFQRAHTNTEVLSQVRRVRLREGKQLTQSHTARVAELGWESAHQLRKLLARLLLASHTLII